MLSGLVGALPLPEECVVLLLQGTRVCKSCFLESSNVYVQSSRHIVNDSCLPGVLDTLQTCGEACHHCPDIQTPQFQNWSFLMMSFVVAWCQGSSLLFGWSFIPMHPTRMTDRGGTAPYWLGAAQLEAGDSCPVRSEDLAHRREQPLTPCPTPVERWLITGIHCSPCCVHAGDEAGMSSPGMEIGVGD